MPGGVQEPKHVIVQASDLTQSFEVTFGGSPNDCPPVLVLNIFLFVHRILRASKVANWLRLRGVIIRGGYHAILCPVSHPSYGILGTACVVLQTGTSRRPLVQM